MEVVEREKNFCDRTRDDHNKFNRRSEGVTRQLTSSISRER